MRQWVTEIKALNPSTNQMKVWGGPNIPGITKLDAEQYCQNNGLGYCKIIGELIEEIPCKNDSYEADFENKISYENLN